MGENGKSRKIQRASQNRQAANPEQKAQIQVTKTTFEGPLPAPQILADYDKVYTGAAGIIIKEFKENSKYIRDANQKAMNAQIEKEKRGQYMAYSILIGILIVVCISLIMGNTTFAGVSGVAFIALSAKSFIAISRTKNK